MRVLESRSLTILATDTCTAECAHCSMGSSPSRRGKLSASQICHYVDQAASSTAIRTVIFAGGEPLLLGKDLFRALRHVRGKGLKSRLVTNAYWANTENTATEITGRLRESGLDELNISIDDYHLPYIRPENVKRAFDAALLLDFDAVIVVHCTGPATKFNDKELDELLGVQLPRMYDERKQLKPMHPVPGQTYVAVSNTSVQFIGRGAVELRPEEVAYTEGWGKRSRELGGCPWAVRSPAVSPAGHLLSCCGFEVAGNEVLDIGDLDREPLEVLLDKADNDLLLNIIAMDGPYRMLDFLKEQEPNLPFRHRYSSFCELCQHIVSDPRIRQALYRNMHMRAPNVVLKRTAILDQAKEDVDFAALYHASDPGPMLLEG